MKRIECEGVGDNNGFYEMEVGQSYTQRRLEEFEETTLVTKAGSWLECSDYEGTVNEMRVFLSTSIAQAVAEEREMVVGEIEKMRKEVHHFPSSYSETLEYKEEVGYNKALDDLLSSLQEINPKKE